MCTAFLNLTCLALVQLFSQRTDVLPCKLCQRPPVIDGVLDDECWGKAAMATDFRVLRGRGIASQRTECMVSYDATHLYIAFRCFEDHMQSLRHVQHLRDGLIWTDDCVEVFVDPSNSRKQYFHLITNFNGAKFDERCERGLPLPCPWTWDGDWQVGIGTFPGGWTVEIALSLKSLGVPLPTPGTVWAFNVNRQERRLEEESSWSETRYWFHEPYNFGKLLFVPPF